MPNWKKLIVSGSDASLNSLNVTNNVTAQSFTGSFSGSFTAPGATTQVIYNNGGTLAANSGFVYSGSNVGIGTTSPTTILDIQPSSGTPVFRIARTGGTDVRVGASVTATGGLIGTYTASPFSIYTNSSAKVTVTSDGNVGIGTTSPSSSLDVVVSSGGTSGLRFRGFSDAATPYLLSLGTYSYPDHFQINSVNGLVTMGIVGSTGANPDLAFQTNTTERMRILSNGNVGIGTTSPSYKLDVNGSFNALTSGVYLTYNSGILYHGNYYQLTSGNNYLLFARTSGDLILGSNDTERIRISSAGNVGIGTTSPTAKLEVNGNVKATSFTGSFSGSFTAPGSTTQIVYNDNGVLAANSGLVYSGSNVGIGISAPTEKLHIVSSATGNQFGRITATDSNSSAAWVAQNDSGDNVVYRVFSSGVSGTQMGNALGRSASLLANLGGSGVFLLGTFSNTNFILGTNNTENMRITTAGNVGIGTSSPTKRLHVRDTASPYQINLQSDTSKVWAAGVGISGYYQDWFLLSDGTSDIFRINAGYTEITNNIYASANIGIGTASPSQKLEVQGQAQIGNDSVTSAGLFFARKNTNQAKSHYFLSAQESPTYQWIEGGYFTSELAGVSVANNSGKPYYESYAPAGQNKSFGFINQTTSGSSFTSTAATASMTLYQGGDIALAYNGGNVGIGTSSPGAKLQVVGGEIRVDAGQAITLDVANTMYLVGASNQLRLYNGGNPVVNITTGGNVGIGTTSPETKLHVASGDVLISNGQYYSAEGNTGGNYKLAGITSGNVVVIGAIDYTTAGTIFAGGDNISITTGGVAGTSRLNINSAGNVGIGTTSPGYRLDVAGYTNTAGFFSRGANIGLETQIAALGTNGAYQAGYYLGATNTVYAARLGMDVNSGDVLISAGNTGSLSTLAYFKANGNIGIGTSSPGYKLEVVGAVSASTYYGDGSNLTGIGSGSVAAAGSDGQLQYNNSGLFGGASRLYYNDSTNRVGIGISSPGYDLDVSGSVRVQDRLRVGPVNSGNGVIHQSSDATINASSSTIVWSVPGSAGICAFIEYYIFNSTTGTSQRAGNIVTTWNSAGTPQITHTETTTPDIGTTALVTFTTSITLGGDPQLVATNTSINPFYIVLNYRYF